MPLTLAGLHIAILFIAGLTFVMAATTDAYFYRIPNFLCALLLILFPLFVITAPHTINWQQSIGVFALVSIAGYAMYRNKFVGARDIKLLSCASLWAGPHFIAVLLAVTAVAGALESMIMLGVTYARHRAYRKRPRLIKVPIPYGVAIAIGGLTVLGMIAQPILFPL